ncbi:hypothetical protein GCM10028820_01290 [Tessaracoccus terricola]
MVSASALMASGTLISRALGLVRVMLIALILGNGTRQADILALATMVPNSLYILFAGGALNTVLVPQIVRAIKNDADGGEAYTNRIMTAFMLIVGAVAVVVTVCAPLITQLYSSEAWRAEELAAQYASMVALTYLTLPQVFFYGAFFLLGQVLNARDKFGPMMWAPIANNVISVLVLCVYLFVWGTDGNTGAAFTTPQVLLLGIGSTVGIAAQTLVLVPYLRKVGFRFRPRFDLKGTGLGKTFSLTKWTMGFVAVNQIVLVIVTRLATSATAGGSGSGYNVYSNAHLIWILPHSLITVSLATAMLPNASRLAASENFRGVAQEATKTIRLALILLVPAAVGFFVLADPIAALLFGHGQGTEDSQYVGLALMGFAVGLIPFTVQFVCLRTYYALEDTRTPFFLQLVIAGANAGLALLFVWLVTDPGLVAAALALAYSVAYLVGVFVSWQLLKRQVPELAGGPVALHIVRLLLGAGLGGVAAYFVSRLVVGWLGEGILGGVVAILVGLVLIGAVYLLVGRLLRVRELTSLSGLVNIVRRRGAVPAESEPGPARTRKRKPAPQAEVTDDGWDVDEDHEYSAGSIAAGLTEDLMPTQLTPAISLDDDFEPSLAPGRRAEPARPVAAPEPEPEPSIPLYRDELTGDAPEPADEWAERADFDEESMQETRLRPPLAGPGASALAAGGAAALSGAAPAPTPVPGLPGDDAPADDLPADDDAAEETDRQDSADMEAGGEPEPATDGQPADESLEYRPLPPIAVPGLLLSTRFRTDELLAKRDSIETWRAHDLVLSRDVIAHVLRTEDPRIPDVLDAARKGAVATDSRFLRVLDAVEVSDHENEVGAYVVCEYTTGKNLREILGFGPLSTLESAWIVRELADALSSMHAQGLFHEHLTPENVIITNSGDVKLVGFGVEAAISLETRATNWTDREASDVHGLAKLLYATLVQRWPGGPDFGMEAAPIIAGEPASPHIVRAGVSPALDRITSATLTERGAAAERRITTAGQLAASLSEVLGTADPSSDLEHRVRAARGSVPKRSAEPLAEQGGSMLPEDSNVMMAAVPREPEPAPMAAAPPVYTGPQSHADDAPEEPEDYDEVEAADTRPPGRRALWLLVAFVLAALVISLVVVAINNAEQNAGQDPTSTTQPTSGDGETTTSGESTAPTGPFQIVGGADFDPAADNGNDEENPDSVPLAFDGDPATGWPTLRYHNNPEMGGLKPGVGLVLDLGEPRPVAEVELLFEAPGATVELRVPADATVTSAPMTSESEWSVLATQADAPETTVLTADAATETQFVLIYLTKLPQVEEARFLAQLNEVTVR